MKNSHLRTLQAGLNPLALPSTTALLAFREAATHLSFRNAADVLGLTPSAVSHQIRGLEAQFGVRLFARSTRAIMLTPAGVDYLEGVKSALEMLETAGGALMELAGSRQSALRVSALPFFSSTVMLPHLAQLQAFCPGLTVKLEATHDYADFDGLGVDVAIRYGKSHTAGLRFERLVDVVSLPVCKPKLARSIVRPSDLGAMTLIHLTAQPDAWPAWLAANKVPDLVPAGEMWVDSVPSALEAAEHGLGIALAMHPLIAARDGFGKTLVAPFKPSGSTGTFYLVTRSEQAHDRRIAAFRAWLSSALEQVQHCP